MIPVPAMLWGIYRGDMAPPVLAETPWLLWGEGSAGATRETRDGAPQSPGRRWWPGPARGGHQGCSQTEANPGLRALQLVGCVFMGNCLNPSGLICRVRMKFSCLSHTGRDPAPPLPMSWGSSRPRHQPALPSPGRDPTLTRRAAGSGSGKGEARLLVVGGQVMGSDRQPLASATREESQNASVPAGTQASLRPGTCLGGGLAQGHSAQLAPCLLSLPQPALSAAHAACCVTWGTWSNLSDS